MSLSDLNSKEAVLRAIAEYDELGGKAFLERYRFGVSRRYLLAHDGSTYDSKAIAGVAYGYEFPESGPLRSDEFSGGLAGAATKLRSLGFQVTDETGERPDRSPDRPTMDTPDSARSLGRAMLIPARDQAPNVILLGCVKRKLTVTAPAQDLYTSDLFRKRRAYADGHPCPWFILSAKHGLVSPTETLEPYDLALKDQSSQYRRIWGEQVVDRLNHMLGGVAGQHIEVHAGAPYVEALRGPLTSRGGLLSTPLSGLRQGEQLAWYLNQARPGPSAPTEGPEDAVHRAVQVVGNTDESRPPEDFPWGRSDLGSAGLYSWWVDSIGADAISSALGAEVAAGLVYAGQAGATAWPSGKRSDATLLSRIDGNHLRGRVTASTWRLSLAATLYDHLRLEIGSGILDTPSNERLTAWMIEHLRLAVLPIGDRDMLADVEARLLVALDPPMNIKGMQNSRTRTMLSGCRRDLRRRLNVSLVSGAR